MNASNLNNKFLNIIKKFKPKKERPQNINNKVVDQCVIIEKNNIKMISKYDLYLFFDLLSKEKYSNKLEDKRTVANPCLMVHE